MSSIREATKGIGLGMVEKQITLSGIVTTVLWLWVSALIMGAWLALWSDHDQLAEACGFTACASSAVAATASIRRYACRLSGLIRALHGLEGEQAKMQALHSIR